MTIDRYNPVEIEKKWYGKWMEHNLFAPSMDRKKPPFCIVIPPPNVTGSLHMGHAWDNTIQDILIRWKRMQGDNTLWIPGTDHAGIATQWMVEKGLRERGLTKEDLGREKFLEEAWKFKEESHKTIAGQLRSMGVSCDWERERFTLDDGLSRAVRRVFVSLFREGLIYRANRMISWCPRCLTALSDLEVNAVESEGRLWHFRYPMADGGGEVIVATTRPETMLGDTAVAVHPDDGRYSGLEGRSVMLPLAERLIPVISDSYVDQDFGSGAVKITPGHDPNDFEIGRRHKLELITVMNEDGTINDNAPEPFRGLDRFEARKRVLEALEAKGLLAKEEKHLHAVGHCSRCNTVVEPRVSLQWFVKMRGMADEAVKAVKSGRIEFVPRFQEKIFFEWMSNIQDWCISRQLWWGHRIPVWYCHSCGEVLASEEDISLCTACGSGDISEDEDVLDTWFSSGLWPFSTMGWPDATEELETFYPTSVLVTAYDILFFWVARMAMLGIKFMGKEPFAQVLLHGLLRDKFGEKMSKTKGNGIDPLEMIDQYGADTLRLALSAGTIPGRDMSLQVSTIEGYRNFINKIWNATRFALGHGERLGSPPPLDSVNKGLFDRWILGRFNQAAREANDFLEKRRFDEATKALYAFVWHELCDWYVEIVKPALLGDLGAERQAASHATLQHVLAGALKLLHPFMPFVTEELWRELPAVEGFIMVQPYPDGGGSEPDPAMAQAASLIEIVQTVRTVRGENGVAPRKKIDVVVTSRNAELLELVRSEQEVFNILAGISELTLAAESFGKKEGYGHGVGEGFEVFLSLKGLIDLEQERSRIGKELERTHEKISRLAAKLDNPNFTGKAPPTVVEKNRKELFALEIQRGKLDESLTNLPPAQ